MFDLPLSGLAAIVPLSSCEQAPICHQNNISSGVLPLKHHQRKKASRWSEKRRWSERMQCYGFQ